MKHAFGTALGNPVLRVLLVAGAVVAIVALPEWGGSGDPAPRAGRAYAKHSHPLLYDSQLGMYGHSDHVGTRYPFTEEAKFQEVPSAAVAAGLKPPPQEANAVVSRREVVHLEKGASDAQADAAIDSKGALWVAYCSFREGGENVYVRRRGKDGAWGEETALSARALPDFHPKIEADAAGNVWVVWSRQGRDGTWPLVFRRFDGEAWNKEIILPRKNYNAALERDPESGALVLVYENWDGKASRVLSMHLKGDTWTDAEAVSAGSVVGQRPALASGRDGSLWLVYDVVRNQKYELRLRRWENGAWAPVPDPPALEGHRRRASLAVDAKGRVWVLPETEVIEPIETRRALNGQDELYNVRPPSRAMLVWTGSAWKALPRGPAMSSKANRVFVDSKGTVWVFSRAPGAGAVRDFNILVQRYRGDKWHAGPLGKGAWKGGAREARRFLLGGAGTGSIKEPVAVLERDGELVVVCHETHRRFTNAPEAWTYGDGPAGTLVFHLKLEAEKAEDAWVVDYTVAYHGTERDDISPLPHAAMGHPKAEATIDGKKMSVFYGDMHHHTEFSRDPGVINDDVDSNYRYIRFIRGLDFEGLADHAEHINPHDWYRIRRSAAFHNDGTEFVAMVASEWTSEFYRNGNYQEGHHNVVYRTDGPEVNVYSASGARSNTPKRLIARVEEDIARAKEGNIASNALLFPHDPSRWVQPISWSWYHPRIKLLELVQSRGAHEVLGGPQKPPLRNDFQQQLMGKSAQDGLAKGFRWGFIGSGDHIGRPLAAVWSPSGDRETIFDSLYAKRTFATTGAKMVLNFSVNGHRMGSEWMGRDPQQTVDIHAVGTTPIALVDLWKNGRMIWRWSPAGSSTEFKMRYQDPSAPYFRENYWYVRVMQADGHIAWSSPVWYIYEEIEPVVVADAGGPEPHYVMPQFPIPLPVLMRNQKSKVVKGKLELVDVPEGWRLAPAGAIGFELPPESWQTYDWTVTAPAGSIKELKAIPIKLRVTYAGGGGSTHAMTVIQSPKYLNTRRQLSELNDAMYLMPDVDELNRWLKTMAKRWKM